MEPKLTGMGVWGGGEMGLDGTARREKGRMGVGTWGSHGSHKLKIAELRRRSQGLHSAWRKTARKNRLTRNTHLNAL